MQRRSFIGALIAAAGGIAVSGPRVLAASPPAIADDQSLVRKLLRDCRVVTIEQEVRVGAPTVMHRIVYRHSPNEAFTILDRDALVISESSRICSVSVTTIAPRMRGNDYEIEVYYL